MENLRHTARISNYDVNLNSSWRVVGEDFANYQRIFEMTARCLLAKPFDSAKLQGIMRLNCKTCLLYIIGVLALKKKPTCLEKTEFTALHAQRL